MNDYKLINLKKYQAEVYNSADTLLDKDFCLPKCYRLTANERIKLKNIIWFISHHQAKEG